VQAAAAGLLIAAVLFGDGSSDARLLWIGGAAVLAAGAAAIRWFPRPGRAATIFLSALTVFVLWNGLSVLWSVEPDRSWNYFNRSACYLAFAVVGLVAGGLVARAPRRAAAWLAALFGVALAWALLGKVFPGLDPDGERVARLRGSLGYWNALALVAAMAVPVSLWLAARRAHAHAARAAGALLFFLATVALLLTYSRGGALVALAALGLWLVLGSPRLESVVAALGAGAAGLAVAFVGFALPGVSEERQPQDVRADDGLLFGLTLLTAAALVFGVAYLASRAEARRPLDWRVRRRLGRGAAVAAAALAVATVAVGVARAGSPVDWVGDAVSEFSKPLDPTVGDEPGRFVELSSNTRWNWWEDALEVFRNHPVVGAGAGAYDIARRPFREDTLAPIEPHSLPLQFLAELGVVGLFLIGTAAVAAIAGVAATLRRAEGADRAAVAALSVVAAAYAVDGLAEFNWDFIALSGPVFLVVGLLLGLGASAARLRPLRGALGVAALVASLLLSLAFPWLAQRKVDDARAAIANPARSARLAEDAHDLNPLAVEPLLLWADAEEARSNGAKARRLLVDAVELQPENARTWRELGEFELQVRDRRDLAEKYLARARELDPEDPLTQRLLDRVK
jgi:O-antigen ligase/polysaccharide polymerase Wzy-like membrane protein